MLLAVTPDCNDRPRAVGSSSAARRSLRPYCKGAGRHRRYYSRVRALIDQGRVNPAAIRGISLAFWEITPFYCPECGLNYCGKERDTSVVFDEGLYDRAEGTCPNGHRHTLDD